MKNKRVLLALIATLGLLQPVNAPAFAATFSQPASVNIPLSEWSDASISPRAVMLCIHGLGLHKGNFAAFGKRMAQEGIVTYAMDLRGFGEWQKYSQYSKVDMVNSMADIGRVLSAIKKKYPSIPIIMVGESMGGAVALHATARYPEYVSGLISSVPAADRQEGSDSELHIALNAFFRGFDAPINVGKMVLKRSTKNEVLRQEWQNDPQARMNFTIRELMQFQKFMKDNLEQAHLISKTPVLLVQGGQDNLVIPAGTLALRNAITSPNKQFVLSGSSEHLIFEIGQFNEKVLGFVLSWVDKNVAPLPESQLAHSGPNTVASIHEQPIPETAIAQQNTNTNTSTNTQSSTSTQVAMAQPQPPEPQANGAAISYWIELMRGGKKFKCNSRVAFKSGDKIRFHVIPEADGYAYVVLKQGSSGQSAVLFPRQGNNNLLRAGLDYPLPYDGWLAFDQNPGIEKLSLMFSRNKVDTSTFDSNTQIAYVAEAGSKDIVPTRMKLSWDPDAPSIISADAADAATIAQGKRNNVTKLVCLDPGVLAVDIALAHK